MTTKAEISKNISKKLDLPLHDGKKITEIFLSVLKKQSQTKRIKISGFGIFYVHNTPQRAGRNPKTRESYIIKPSKKLVFKTSKKIREILN